MRYPSLLLLAVFIGTAQTRIEPVGVVHEWLNSAVELPDSRVCVLTAQRLALLASADAKEPLDSHWTLGAGRRHFTIHDGHALVANGYGIEILRIGDTRFEKVGGIEIRYAWQSPLIVAHGQLFVMQAGREFNVYSLADISAPKHLRELRLPQSGNAFAVAGDHLFLGGRGKLIAYDIRDAEQMPEVSQMEWPLSRIDTMEVRGAQLFVSVSNKLHGVDVSDPRAMTMSEDVEKVGEEWPVTAADPKATREALESSGLWTRRPLQATARIDSHLLLFDGAMARVYDIADSATPRLVGSCEFAKPVRSLVTHRQRIYTNSGIVDLSEPRTPLKRDFPTASTLRLDGDTLYHFYSRKLTLWSLAGDEPEETAEVKVPRLEAGFVIHDGRFYHADDGKLMISQLESEELETIGSLKLGSEAAQPLSMMVEDGILYVGTTQKGLRLVDVRDPTEPRLLASLNENQRFDGVLGRHGMVFAGQGHRGLVAVDMRRKMAVVERGPMLGRGYVDAMGDYLVAAVPEAGVGIFHSPALEVVNADLRKQAPLRAKLARNPTDLDALAKLAILCDKQGDLWEAGRLFAALAGKDLDAETKAAATAFEARRKADAEAARAKTAFEDDLRKERFGDVERVNGEIVRLRIFQPKGIKTHLAHLATLSLTSLDLLTGPIGAEELALLSHFPKLKRLRLRQTDAESAAFAPLAMLTKLEHLNLEEAPLPPDALAHIANLSTLEYLDLEGTGTDDTQLAHIAGLKNLGVLDLEGCPITDAGLAHLSQLRKLTVLRLEDCKLSGEGFHHLAGLKLLENLDLEYVPATTGYASLAGMTRLEDLDLDYSGITDAELAHLAGLKRLENLQLGETKIGSEGVAHLAGLSGLTTLDLSGTGTNDLAMPLIGGMSNLENLDLRSTGISDDGLAHLRGLQRLEWLGIQSIADLSDDGLAELAGLKALRRVSARWTSVTAAGAELLPKASVQWKEEESEEEKADPQQEPEIVQMPAELAFDIAENALRLLDAATSEEYARETPADLFGLSEIELRGVVTGESECWVASSQGLLRFQPRRRAWSRFAIDREHLNVSVDALANEDGVLVVGFGAGREARFDLNERRWLTASIVTPAAAVVAVAVPPQAGPTVTWVMLAAAALVLLVSGMLLQRR